MGTSTREAKFIMSASLSSRALLSTRKLIQVPSRGKALENWARPSMDELLIPTKPHAEVHAANQQKFLIQLLGGVVFFAGTVYATASVMSGKMNSTPYHLLSNKKD